MTHVCRVEASKKTKGGRAECPESTQKTDSKADYEMDISDLYESDIKVPRCSEWVWGKV